MKTIFSEKVVRILKNKKRLEKILNVKIFNQGNTVFLEGKPEDEYVGEKVVEALNFGFPFSSAVKIKKEDLFFEILNIKDYTKRNNLESIRARIIGKSGKTLKTLSDLTSCFFERNGNEVGIIGKAENLQLAQNAVISIIHGAKQNNIYKSLEHNRPSSIEDFGLKSE